jgi:tRNA(fMet)-specific endonuclease VapC
MLDTNICSYIMKEHPIAVLEKLAAEVEKGNQIVISTVTYMEMRTGQIGKKASPKLKGLIDEFVARVDAILPLDSRAIDSAIEVMDVLSQAGKTIGTNDTLIAGHALATGCVLVSNNLREFSRVPGLNYANWV